jgi:hypothetical protein
VFCTTPISVARRLRGQEVRHLEPARARHVLHDHVRRAWDVAGDVAREQAREHVVLAAGADADQERDGLAAVEVGDRLGMRRHGGAHEHCAARGAGQQG